MRLRGLLPVLFVLLLVAAVPRVGAAPEGQLPWAVHVSLAPTWFDPAEAPGIITPYMIFYALHDAVAKPMPGEATAPGPAEAWSVPKDGGAAPARPRRPPGPAASGSRSPGPPSGRCTRAPRAPAGSCRRSTSRRSAT